MAINDNPARVMELLHLAESGKLPHTHESAEEVFPHWLHACVFLGALHNVGLSGLPDPDRFAEVPNILGNWLIEAMIASDTLSGGPIRSHDACHRILIETMQQAIMDAEITIEVVDLTPTTTPDR